MSVKQLTEHIVRYAPFLYVTGYSLLTLLMGELSPQVTERDLQPFSNDKINLSAYTMKISVNIAVGESQNLQTKSRQNWVLSFGMVIFYPLRPRCARPPLPKGEARALTRYPGAPLRLLGKLNLSGF